jgi:signal peptidase II
VLLITCLIIISLDQWTKGLIVKEVPLHRAIEVIPGFFNITHVRNTGGAFGIFGGERGGFGSFLFMLFSLIATGGIIFFFIKVKENEKNLALSFSLVLSGAIGNLIDRFRYGEVVDFLEVYLSSFHWPSFNIADSAISTGIGLLALELLVLDRKKKDPIKNNN